MYEFNITLDGDFEQTLERVRASLQAHHLGIVSEVNVQAIMKNKLDKEIPGYRIFGACNPKLADRVIQAEPNAGTLLPCNFVIREIDPQHHQVSFMDPVAMLSLSEHPELARVAQEAKGILQQVVDELQNGS
jgi:uncharacterized protein (DUF302 family)